MWYGIVYGGGGGEMHLSIVSLSSQLASHRTSATTSAQAQVDQTKLQLSLEQAWQDVVCIVHGGNALKYCATMYM